jgi:large repetitive protein
LRGAAKAGGRGILWAALVSSLLAVPRAQARTEPTIDIVVTPSPTVLGQPLSVAVTVTGSAGAGTGFVELQVNGNSYGGFVALAAGGMATLSIPGEGVPSPSTILPIAAGSCTTPGAPAPNTVGVLYSGDANYLPSTAAVCLAVGPSLAVSTSPAVYGQALTYTATVDSFDTGTVSFFDGTATLTATATINNGQAQFTPSLPIAVGNHAITAVFNGQTSNVVNVAVNKANTATVLTFAQSGPNVMLKATVSVVAPGGGTPTGTVQFFNGSALLGSAPISNGGVSLAASNFAGSITAQYSGDGNFNGSGSPAVSVNALLPAETRLIISSSLNPSMLGQAVTFTASLSVSQGVGTPGGSVQFLDGVTPIGSASISGGSASVTTSTLTVGSHAITAQYSGDSVFPAASVSMGQVVNRVQSTLTLAASATQVTSIQTVTLTAQVGPKPPAGVPAPTGQILFSDGGTLLGSGTLSAGAASITTSTLSVGTHQFSAKYGGDANYAGASASVGVQVTLAPVAITTNSLSNAAVGQPYNAGLVANGGTPPYSWSISGLPPGLTGSSSGAISGTPTINGSYSVAVQVTDSNGGNASVTLGLTVVVLPLTISATLPGGKQGVSYSGDVSVSGGVPPYTLNISGLPQGLAASAAGAITGQPMLTGTSTISVQVSDSKGASASQQFSITVASTLLTITTTSLPGGTAGQPYSQPITAIGGAPPYSWSGTLPAGLSIDPMTGAISGTPSVGGGATVTVTVSDTAGASVSSTFTLNFALPALPVLSFTGVGKTADPQTQPTVGVQLAGPYPVEVQGTLVLSFEAATGADSGEVVFASGGRTVTFLIPANATAGQFPGPNITFQTGTVAGTITITATLQAGGADITPSPQPAQQIQVPAGPPVITNVQASAATGGFTVAITGFTTTREVTQAVFQFNPASGANLQTTSLTVSIGSLFAPWLTGSQVVGSQFLYTQQFTVQGETSAIASITVTIANTQGVSQAMTAALP